MFPVSVCHGRSEATVNEIVDLSGQLTRSNMKPMRPPIDALIVFPSNSIRWRASQFEGLTDCSEANLERYSLVLQGKLLCTEEFCLASGITEQRLSSEVASGRIFSVEFEAEPYYPAFFLSKLFDREDFTKVVRLLGESTGWSKWKFFTTPRESLDGLTPLRLLMREEVARALRAAEDFSHKEPPAPVGL